MSSTNLASKEDVIFNDDLETVTVNDKEHFLSTPITIDLSDNGGKISFKTFEDSINWSSEELDIWRYVAVSASPLEKLPFLSDIIAQQLSPAENILEAYENNILTKTKMKQTDPLKILTSESSFTNLIFL